MKLLLNFTIIFSAFGIAAGASAANSSVQLTVNLDIQQKSPNGKTSSTRHLHSVVNVPFNKTSILSGANSTTQTNNEPKSESSTELNVTPSLTADDQVQLDFKILRNGQEISKPKIIVALGQSAEVSTVGDEQTFKLKVKADKPHMLPVGKYDLIDKVEKGLPSDK